MSHATLPEDEHQLATLRVNELMATSWDELAVEIRRLFKLAITSASQGRRKDGIVLIMCAERILDAIGSLMLHAESMSEEHRSLLRFSIEQCEAEAQRLFDAFMTEQPAAVLSTYAERGLIASYGLQRMFMALEH